MYALRCKELNILPLDFHFQLNDLLLFHRIFYKLIPINFPSYMYIFDW